MNIFQVSVDEQTPITQNQPKARKLIPKSPWVTPSLCKSINHKNKLYRRYVANPTDSSRYKYVRYKNIHVLINVLRNSKRQYNSQQFEREKGNIKNTWKIINSVLQYKLQSKINVINIDGVNVSNPQFIANHFNNNYFTSIGQKLSNAIDPNNFNNFKFTDYLLNANPNSLFLSLVTESVKI